MPSNQAVATSNASNAASGNEQATASTETGPAVAVATARQPVAATTLGTVLEAVERHKVVALLFYDPGGR